MADFIVRQGDEMLNFLIKKFDMINIYLKELEEYGSTSNEDMGNIDAVDSIVQSLYDEDILYRKHYDYNTLYNLVWNAMDKAAKIANKKYIKQQNKIKDTNNAVMKINESQLRNIIKESVNKVLNEDYALDAYSPVWDLIEDMKQYMSVDDILTRLITRIGPDAAVRYLQDIKTTESIDESKKKIGRSGTIQNKYGEWVNAVEDGMDKNGNPMYRTHDSSITHGRKCKDGSRRVQDYNFRPN